MTDIPSDIMRAANTISERWGEPHLYYGLAGDVAAAILAERQRAAEVATSWAKTCQNCGQVEGEGVANDIAVCIMGGTTT